MKSDRLSNTVRADGPTKILYISGRGRSGSTVLDSLLGQVDGVFNLGEMRLWNRRWRADAACGCGQPLQRCEVWRAVLDEAFEGEDSLETALDLQEVASRNRYYALALSHPGRKLLRPQIEALLHQLSRLYRAIRVVTQSDVIVDSSKSPLYGFMLNMLPDVELHVVHLVRDPRAVAYSWIRQQHKATLDGDPLYRRNLGPVKSTLLWNIVNLAAARLARDCVAPSMTLRYEDFARAPRESLINVLSLLGMQDSALPFRDDHEAMVTPSHTVSGNPNRFRHGGIRLHPDQEWATALEAQERRVVSMLASPWLGQYGYE